MKRFLPLLAVVLSGCLTVQALNPFYTEQTRIPLPELEGEWFKYEADHPNRTPTIKSTFVFHRDGKGYRLRCYENKGQEDFVVVPFRVGTNTYIDFLQKTNDVHALYRVAFQGRTLSWNELDGDWLTNSIASGESKLPPPDRDESSNLVFRASSQQWTDFLAGTGTNAVYTGALMLTRSPSGNFTPLRRK